MTFDITRREDLQFTKLIILKKYQNPISNKRFTNYIQ